MPAAVQYDWSLFKNKTTALWISIVYNKKFVGQDECCFLTNQQWTVDVKVSVGFVRGRGGPRHI